VSRNVHDTDRVAIDAYAGPARGPSIDRRRYQITIVDSEDGRHHYVNDLTIHDLTKMAWSIMREATGILGGAC